MKNIYHSDIMQLLMLKGKEGMHVADLTRMVYNLHVNFFDRQLNYHELHNTLRNYLWRQSHMRRSPFMHVRYGFYAIKPDIAVQLDLCFDEEFEDSVPSQKKTVNDPLNNPRQLLLFEDMRN